MTRATISAVAAISVAASLITGAALAQQKTIAIGTGGTGGVYYPLGGGLANVLSKYLPGYQATAEVTGGSVDNLKLIGSGQSEIGFSMADAALDAFNGQVYCSGTQDIEPTDDAGKVPEGTNGKATLSCEDTTNKELGKLAAAMIKCHIKMADAFFKAKDFDENACEESGGGKSAIEKFNAAMDKLDTKGTCTDACNARAQRDA